MRKLEICCGSVEDVITASQYEIDSIELNTALPLGGLTPSIATLILSKEITDVPLYCMVRNNPGGFIYNENEFKTMLKDAQLLLENGADGIVFGCLRDDLQIETNQTNQLIQLAKKYNKQAIFHRAIDLTPNYQEAYQLLIDLGIDRVLTSGGKPTAVEGIDNLRKLNKINPDKFLVGSGVTPENVHYFDEFNYLHATCKELRTRINGNDVVTFDFIEKNKEYHPSRICIETLVAKVKK